MSDDEQGYAPAAYLEPVEGGRKQHNVEQQQMESENTTIEGEHNISSPIQFQCMNTVNYAHVML